MSAIRFGAIAAALLALGLAAVNAPPRAQAQDKEQAKEKAKEATKEQAKRPQIETTKVDGTDNVYIFRNGNHQAMFVVTKEGVIATDPVAYGRPTGGQDYVNEIRKITQAPIRYLIYSHHHFDHIAGGKAFKDAGATIIAHKNAQASGWPRSTTRTRRCPIAMSATTPRCGSAAPRWSCAISAPTTPTPRW